MLVSIVTICYNNQAEIEDTILSVVNQSYKYIEYIIIDGGSSDNSLNIIEKYKSRISKLISEPDEGIYDAINKGIRNSTGQIVGLIHAGDKLFDDNVIKDVVDCFKQNTPDIIYGHSKICNSEGVAIRINRSPKFKRFLPRIGWMPSHQSIYVKSALFKKCGYYLLDYKFGDYEWFVRYFCKYNFKIVRLNRYMILFALGGTSTKNYKNKLSKSSFKDVKECWKVNGLNAPPAIEFWKLIRKPWQFILAFWENM